MVWSVFRGPILEDQSGREAFPCSVALVFRFSEAFPCSVALVFRLTDFMKRYLLPALFSMFMAQGALADAFQISDIRVNGLQRVSAGSVFTSLPPHGSLWPRS